MTSFVAQKRPKKTKKLTKLCFLDLFSTNWTWLTFWPLSLNFVQKSCPLKKDVWGVINFLEETKAKLLKKLDNIDFCSFSLLLLGVIATSFWIQDIKASLPRSQGGLNRNALFTLFKSTYFCYLVFLISEFLLESIPKCIKSDLNCSEMSQKSLNYSTLKWAHISILRNQ